MGRELVGTWAGLISDGESDGEEDPGHVSFGSDSAELDLFISDLKEE